MVPSSCPAQRYEILGLLDSSGRSCVYRATDKRSGQIIALRFIYPDRPHHSEDLRKFLQAAELLSFVTDPGVTRITDFGVTADNKPFIACEFVEGSSLQDILARTGRIRVGRAAAIFCHLAGILQNLHSRGHLMGEIRPSHVMLLLDEENRELVRLVDFGLSNCFTDSAGQDEAEHWRRRLYMSPEQCRNEPIDRRSDIYSFGCLMYESLTGAPPFISKDARELAEMHKIDTPRSMREARSDLQISPELDQVVLKALGKSPGERQQSMEELQAELEHACRLLEPQDALAATHVHLLAMRTPIPVPPSSPARTAELKWKVAVPLIAAFLVFFGAMLVLASFEPQSSNLYKSPEEKRWQELCTRGERALESGELDSAEDSYREAVAVARRFGNTDRRLLTSLRKLQDIYQSQGNAHHSDRIEEEIRQLLER